MSSRLGAAPVVSTAAVNDTTSPPSRRTWWASGSTASTVRPVSNSMSWAHVEVAVVHACRLRVGLAAQDGLGQWWSLVGQLVFVADEDDTPVEAGAAGAFGGVGAGQAGADDDERLVSGHGHVSYGLMRRRRSSRPRWATRSASSCGAAITTGSGWASWAPPLSSQRPVAVRTRSVSWAP